VRSLRASGMWNDVLAWARSEKPFFGICVGYQMLFESSEEAPGEKGLGLLAGQVKKFSDKHGLKIPQIGWNTLKVLQPDAPLLAGISDGDYAYVVHSYYTAPEDRSIVAFETSYGDTFASGVARGNLLATQFHPEKSQRAGLQMLKNFVELSSRAAALTALVP
jgi:glutamine amidotransferase